jgi:hypothetical protein
MNEKVIKPCFPGLFLFIAAALGVFSALLWLGKNSSWEITILAGLLFSCAVSLLLLIDHAYLTIHLRDHILHLTGYFGIRKLALHEENIKGFEIQQRLDQDIGVQNIIVLVTDKKKILFPRAAYKDHDEVYRFFDKHYKYLGIKEMKNAELAGKLFVLMSACSGIIMFMLAMVKLVKFLSE